MTAVNTHRLHWQTHDRVTGKRAAAHQDFPSEQAARNAKAELLTRQPDAVATVTPIVRRNREYREKIGLGHAQWQGERRMT